MKKTSRKKKPTRSQLIKKLDRVFSQYIRLSSADSKGITVCVTCKKSVHYKSVHAGHFITRRCYPIRWSEQNVHPQCPGCNIFGKGEPVLYRRYVVSIYGESVANMLEQSYVDWKAGSAKKITTPELQTMVDHYSNLVDRL